MATNEKGLVDQIRKDIKELWPDSWFFKVVGHPYQMSGVPDILVCIHGRLFAFEVKFQRPGESREHAFGRASVLQWDQIHQLRTAGAVATVVLSSGEVLLAIREALGEIPS